MGQHFCVKKHESRQIQYTNIDKNLSILSNKSVHEHYSISNSETFLSCVDYFMDKNQNKIEKHTVKNISCIINPTVKRKQLPQLNPDTQGHIKLFKIFKNLIGQDMSNIQLPVEFSQPLSTNQVIILHSEYQNLLEIANEQDDPYIRFAYITIFILTRYCLVSHVKKDYINPILGETYEIDFDRNYGFRYFSEHVMQSPSITSQYVESEKNTFLYYGDYSTKLKFNGLSLTLKTSNIWTIELLKHNEVYNWIGPDMTVDEIVTGKNIVNVNGLLKISKKGCNQKSVINLKRRGWVENPTHELLGNILNEENKQVIKIQGDYTKFMIAEDLRKNNKEIIKWKINSMPDKYNEMQGQTSTLLTLNEHPKNYQGDNYHDYILSTDSRYRKDIRFLEEGNYKMAKDERLKLEKAQQKQMKKLNEKNIEFKPRWFIKRISENGRVQQEQNHEQWKSKKSFNKIE